MKISSEIASIAKFVGQEKAIEYLAGTGFDAWDYSLFHVTCEDFSDLSRRSSLIERSKQLRDLALSLGIHCNQAHAPFPTKIDSAKMALECTAAAGGKICVVHPLNKQTAQENAELFRELLPFAKACGVIIATENMWNWDYEKNIALPAACSSHEDFARHIDIVDDEYLAACLDIGHSEMAGLDTSCVQMLTFLGKRVKALHVHDNDLHRDSHQIPFSMSIDFDKFAKALADIGYDGYLTLEADRYIASYTAEHGEDKVFEGVQNLADAAKKLSEVVECYKNSNK